MISSFVSFVLSLLLLLLWVVPIQADYPGEPLVWKEGAECPDGYDYCGILEFCTGDDYLTYGYRVPCEDEAGCPCSGISGPLIRLQAGKKYRFTLRNSAERDWIETNIHTHGLHIVGDGDSDDIVRIVTGGGNCLDYTWDIAEDHPGGTYWYHAHPHGYTEEQVVGGAYGMLIVEDNTNINPELPEWASNELLLQVAVTWNGVVGNGLFNETISIDANQWYRLRVSVVAADSLPRNLTFDGGNCDIYKVANDGIWRSTVPGPKGNVFPLTGASRADFAIRCQSENDSVAISYFDEQAATIQIGTAEPNPYELSTWIPNRPNSLIFSATADVPDSNKFTIHLGYDTVNNEVWNPDVSLANIAYDEVHEWTLIATSGHPFHLHLYHVLIVTPGGCGDHEEGEFYDTISAPGDCTVRFKTADFGQRCVCHCHILLHEDNGSMAWVDVQGGPDMPLNLVESPEYKCPVFPTAAPSPMPSPQPTPIPTGAPVVVTSPDGPPVPETAPPTGTTTSGSLVRLVSSWFGTGFVALAASCIIILL